MQYEILQRMKEGQRYTATRVMAEFKINRAAASMALLRVGDIKGVICRPKVSKSESGRFVAEKEYSFKR